MRYEWDEAKARHNLAKHGLSFEAAALVFEGPTVTSRMTGSTTEPRFITLGALAGRVVVIAHTLRGENTNRIISMRKANRGEQRNLSRATW